jgi:hypothetical protein
VHGTCWRSHGRAGARRRGAGSGADVEGQSRRGCGGVVVGRKILGSTAGGEAVAIRWGGGVDLVVIWSRSGVWWRQIP